MVFNVKITFSYLLCLFYFSNTLKMDGFSSFPSALWVFPVCWPDTVASFSVFTTSIFLKTLWHLISLAVSCCVPECVYFWKTLLLFKDSWPNLCRTGDLRVGSSGNTILGQRFSVQDCVQQGSHHLLSSFLVWTVSPATFLDMDLRSWSPYPKANGRKSSFISQYGSIMICFFGRVYLGDLSGFSPVVSGWDSH